MTKVHGNSGERNNHARLNDDKVRAIIKLWRECPDMSQSAIAKQVGTSKSTVSRVISKQAWLHVKL